MTRRKPLAWYETELGPTPDCGTCLDRLMEPGFVEAVYSVSIEHPDDPVDLAKRAINRFHASRHPA